jgi:ABC-type antimicrobial peptide transport system permease subunit
MGSYPPPLHQRVLREAFSIYGIAIVVGFALTFVIAWYIPSTGMIWLVVATAQFLFSLVISHKTVRRSFIVLILTCAAVFTAAALQ